MKNQVDQVLITGTRGKSRQVTVIRKTGMLRAKVQTDNPDQVVAAIFETPPQKREEPIQIPDMKYDDNELLLFESAMSSKLNQFQSKRRRRGNRHERVREDDYFDLTDHRSRK